MKMGIERSLKAAFGPQLLEVLQVGVLGGGGGVGCRLCGLHTTWEVLQVMLAGLLALGRGVALAGLGELGWES